MPSDDADLIDQDGVGRPLPGWLAIALVAGTSAAVLVVEILAGRLLAPYVGVSLETYTAIIGTVLAGIALGAGVGGWAADRVDPRRLIPALLGIGGALAIASIPIVRVLGDGAESDGGAHAIVLAAFGFVPVAAVLSAVPPAVAKLQLRDLHTTGETVGRLSAWSTGGAIVGTFLAGFVLVAYAAVTTLIVTVGLLVVAAGAVLWLTHRPRRLAEAFASAALLAVALIGVAVIDTPCDVQSGYYCIVIESDASRASGRTLVLDGLRHSYVDLDDPEHLEFWYVRRMAAAVDAYAPAGPIDVVSIGGGGFTIPRWVRSTRPGSDQIVLEIDPELIEVGERELGLQTNDDIEIVLGDGRVGLREVDDDSADVVIGDAFGSRSVPWHLATKEFVGEIARVLRPGGIYALNVIDGPPEAFLRAEAATIAEVFPHVVVLRGAGLEFGSPANSVIVASQSPLDPSAWLGPGEVRAEGGLLVDDLDEYIDGAFVLTDDFAPVDQLIAGVR